MPTLAPKLPWTHAFAGGYPRLGGQPLPSDPDAIDYLERVKAADGGVGVEVAVAVAVDDFFRDSKAAGVFSALKACCILAGARTLAGALVPVVGDAPTNVANGFVSGDYTRGGATPGLKGDGTSYLDSGAEMGAESATSMHGAAYVSVLPSTGTSVALLANDDESTNRYLVYLNRSVPEYRSIFGNTTGYLGGADSYAVGLFGSQRDASDHFDVIHPAGADSHVGPSSARTNTNTFVFARNVSGTADFLFDGRIAFYSIGTSLSLEDLDTAVTNLITAIGEAL